MTWDCKTYEKVQKLMDENQIFADVYNGFFPQTVEIEISWGDWKHDHAFAKMLVREAGGVFLGTTVTEDNGSDCYSAIHRFFFKSEE